MGADMKKRSCYLILEGGDYTGMNFYLCAYGTKKDAEDRCRNDGFLYSLKEQLWLKDDEQIHRTLEKIDFYVKEDCI
jgi:hypothetical protein